MASFDIAGLGDLGNVFKTPPANPTKTFIFTLVPNAAHAIVGAYAFALRSSRPEFARSQHKMEIKITRMPSGLDHAAVNWEYQTAGSQQRQSFATRLRPDRQASPHGTPLFQHAATNPSAPWRTNTGKPRTGLTYYLEVQSVYRIGADPVSEAAAEIRKLAAAFADGLRAIAARSA